MRMPSVLLSIALALPLPAFACPTGMVFDGNGCSPPYEYTGWDWLQDQYAAIDAIGADRSPSPPGLSREEAEALQRRMLEMEQEKARNMELLAKGVWNVESAPTPEGNLCAATFAKYAGSNNDGVTGGLVTLMGFQQPKQDAWLIFRGTGLPKPRKFKKIKITLQQDDEPAQTVQVFSYKQSPSIGAVAFAVPGLSAALEGMRDKQRFKLSIDGKTAMTIAWADAAPVIKQLRQCAK
jgi:hypothetical protein